MFAIKGVKLDGTEIAVSAAQLAVCIKPTRQSWDFNEELENKVMYSNLGIDTLRIAYPVDSIAELKGKVVGDVLNLSVFNDVEVISSSFVVRDIAIKNGYVVMTTAPELDAEIAEELAK